MPTDTEVGEVFTFVMEEAIRLARLGADIIHEMEGMDFLCALQSADRGLRPIGRPAYDRLRDITNLALEASAHYRRVDPDSAFGKVKSGFARVYFDPSFRGSTDAEDLANLQSWIAEASERCVTLSHVIPCHIGIPRGVKVAIGPVTFESRADAVESMEPKLKAWVEAEPSKGKSRRRDVRETVAYLAAFQDVAHVVVSDCDSKTSEAVANEVVKAALDYIRIVAGAQYTRKIRSGGPALKGDRRSTLAWEADGEPWFTWSARWEGALVDDDFWLWIHAPEQRPLTDAVGVALQHIVDRKDIPMAAARYLEAAAWYSDAAREERPPAAIVKYLTAMERLLWTGERFGITKRLAERAAALCLAEDWNYDELREQIEEAYDLRSGILHGRLSADDPIILRNYRLCETVSRDLLIAWLSRYGWGFDRETTVEKAKAHFDEFVKEVKAEVARQKDSCTVTHNEEKLSPIDQPNLD